MAFQKINYQAQMVSPGGFYQTFKREMTPVCHNLSQKNRSRGMFTKSFYDVSIALIPEWDRDITRKENYRPISIMNIDAKILNIILRNPTQHYIKRIIGHCQLGFITGVQIWFSN